MQIVEQVVNLQDARAALKEWGEYMRAPAGDNSTCRGYAHTASHLGLGFDRHRVLAPITSKPSRKVERVIACIDSLSQIDAKAYMALRLEYWEQLTNEDAANKMKVSVKTFKTWRTNGEYYIMGKLI